MAVPVEIAERETLDSVNPGSTLHLPSRKTSMAYLATAKPWANSHTRRCTSSTSPRPSRGRFTNTAPPSELTDIERLLSMPDSGNDQHPPAALALAPAKALEARHWFFLAAALLVAYAEFLNDWSAAAAAQSVFAVTAPVASSVSVDATGVTALLLLLLAELN